MPSRRTRVVRWILAAAVGLALAAAGAWYWTGRPLYTPGDARRQVEAHPQPSADGSWTVAPGIRLHHFERGRGADVLVLHGGPGIPFRDSVPGLRPLEDRYSFHYYDQRGCGRSSRPFDRFPSRSFFENLKQLESTLGLAAQVGDVERVRRILGRERVVLVGHSFGAFLAALYAAEFPERVRGLVLVSPAAVLRLPSADGGLYAEVERVLPAERLPAYREVIGHLFDFGRLFEKSEADLVALHARFIPFYVEAARAHGFQVADGASAEGGGFMVEAQYLSMGRRHDFRPALGRVTAPTLVIHGDHDLQSLEESAAYRDGIRGARLERFAASGHFSFVDEPERFAAVSGAFLDSLGPE